MTDALPPGVVPFDVAESQKLAAHNFITVVFGGYKTGKTHFWNQSVRPLYVVYLDTNPNLDSHLLKSRGFGDEVYILRIPPIPYKDLTEEIAKSYLDKIEKFAEWAKENARKNVAEGKPGGTFVVDGATYLKGYLEKFYLTESPTLGYRPAAGSRAAYSTYDFVKPNSAIFEFVSGFTQQSLDAIFVFEGRQIWRNELDSKGVAKSVKTDAWKSTRPDRLPFAVNAEIETMKVVERANPSDNKSPLISRMKMRVVYNSENPAFDHMVFDALGHQQFKEMMLSEAVGTEALKDAKHISEVTRANSSGLMETEDEEVADVAE